MKILLLVLLVVIGAVTCQQQQQQQPTGNLTELNTTDIQSNQNVQFLANYGAQNVIREAIDAGDLPEGQYNISRVYEVSQQQYPNGIDYRFDVEISNGQGNSTRARYTVFDEAPDADSDDNDQDLQSYVYQTGPGLDKAVYGDGDSSDVDFSDSQALLGPDVLIANEEENLEWLGEAWLGEDDENDGLAGAYSLLSVEEFNDDRDAQEALDFGLGDVIDQIIDNGDLDNDYPFDLTQIYSVSQQVVSGVNYKYDVGVDNRRGTSGRILFVVYSQPWTNTQRVTSYNYTVTTVTRGRPVTYGATNVAADDAFSDDEDFGKDDRDDTDDDNNAPGGYSEVDPAQAANNTQIQNAQNAGLKYITEQGISTGVLPNAQYTVSKVDEISQQVVNGINYFFDLELTNPQGRLVKAQYYVNVPPGGSPTVTAYRFRS